MAGLLLRALLTAEWTGALFLVGFAALFTWQIGGFITRNRPRRYSFGSLPDGCFPPQPSAMKRDFVSRGPDDRLKAKHLPLSDVLS